MTYDEAEFIAFNSEWTTKHCTSSENCWCRMIVPVIDIVYIDDDNEEHNFYILGPGELNENIASYLVELHNDKIQEIMSFQKFSEN